VAAGSGLTITKLVAAIQTEGYQITSRTIRDWSARGLLDYPARRSLGRGKGSSAATYSRHQLHLTLTLLKHRPDNDIPNLARIPVALWIYFGDEYVSLAQTRRAFATWLGDARSSLKAAQISARRLVETLNNPAATPQARRHLHELVAEIAYTGRRNRNELEHAVQAVFEPGASIVVRARGHPSAPLTSESVVGLIEARLLAASLVHSGGFSDEEFVHARDDLRISIAEYAAQHGELVQTDPAMYEHTTFELLVNESCANLLAVLGLRRQYPRPTNHQPPRTIRLNVPLR
jgi:hypothetical protein